MKDMKMFKKTIIACMAALMGAGLASCGDANEYEDARTDNPSWVEHYTDSLDISHPETVAGTKWVRGSGIKMNVYGEEIQGFVESLEFVTEDAVIVKMSEGVTAGTWNDDSNNEDLPNYEYKYSSITGTVEILKKTYNDKGEPTGDQILFTGVAVSGKQDMMTVVHYGDTPVQTYLVKQ